MGEGGGGGFILKRLREGAAGASVSPPPHCQWAFCELSEQKNTLWINTQSHFGKDVMCNRDCFCLISVFRFPLHRTDLKIWCWTTGRCLTATLAPGLLSWLHTSCIITSPCTFRRWWRSSALPTCWLPRVWERSPSIITSPRRLNGHSPGQHRCGVQRGHLARLEAHPRASLLRRRFHRRAWWSERWRMLSKTW